MSNIIQFPIPFKSSVAPAPVAPVVRAKPTLNKPAPAAKAVAVELPAKPTKAHFKSFIKKHAKGLHIKVSSKFDGMTDGIECNRNAEFVPVVKTERFAEHTFGIEGAWLVGGGRDYFDAVRVDGFVGLRCYNSCGSFTVAVRV